MMKELKGSYSFEITYFFDKDIFEACIFLGNLTAGWNGIVCRTWLTTPAT